MGGIVPSQETWVDIKVGTYQETFGIPAVPMDRPIRHVGGIVLAGGKGKPLASGTFASSVQC